MARLFNPIIQAFDSSGNTIAGAQLFFYVQGTTTPQDTFQDDANTIPNTNPVISGGGGFFPNIFLLNTTYTVQYQDENGVVIWTTDVDGTESPLLSTFLTNAGLTGSETDPLGVAVSLYAVGGGTFYIDNGAANAYVLDNQDDFTGPNSYIDGMMVRFVPANPNTGASTVNVNGIGVRDLVAYNGDALETGDLVSGNHYFIVYSESDDRFELAISPGIESVTGENVDNTDPFNPVIGRFPYLRVQDQKTSGSQGGTFTSGAYQTRTLNTVVSNSITGASLSSNQITLPEGEYYIMATLPGHQVDFHRGRLQNITDATTIINSPNERTNNIDTVMTRALVCGYFTIAQSRVFELQHRCSVTRGTDGFGAAASFGIEEIYSDVKIWKVA